MTDSTKKCNNWHCQMLGHIGDACPTKIWCDCGHMRSQHSFAEGCHGCLCELGMCKHTGASRDVVVCGLCEKILPEMKSSALSSEPAKQTKQLLSPDGHYRINGVHQDPCRKCAYELPMKKQKDLLANWKLMPRHKQIDYIVNFGPDGIDELLAAKDLEAQEKVEEAFKKGRKYETEILHRITDIYLGYIGEGNKAREVRVLVKKAVEEAVKAERERCANIMEKIGIFKCNHEENRNKKHDYLLLNDCYICKNFKLAVYFAKDKILNPNPPKA